MFKDREEHLRDSLHVADLFCTESRLTQKSCSYSCLTHLLTNATCFEVTNSSLTPQLLSCSEFTVGAPLVESLSTAQLPRDCEELIPHFTTS